MKDTRVDMSLHLDTLSWFRANQPLLFLHNAACLEEKQQIPILLYLVWPDLDLNLRSITLKASMLTQKNICFTGISWQCLQYNMIYIIFRFVSKDLLWMNLSINIFDLHDLLRHWDNINNFIFTQLLQYRNVGSL